MRYPLQMVRIVHWVMMWLAMVTLSSWIMAQFVFAGYVCLLVVLCCLHVMICLLLCVLVYCFVYL